MTEKIEKRPLREEMQESYLDYALSVIVSRALPDVRDGLKPVQRRILYAMYEDRLTAQAKFRKSAAVIGNVLSRYHPHGDMAVYDALARLAQNFSLRYPLVDGQGNWGSIDGDKAAAYRYTEARLSKIGEEMLRDIEKNTVDFVNNYDGTRKEPAILPAPIPQLLLNGGTGIAVGVATSIPPHHLGEVCEALIYLIEHRQASVADLLKIIKGPDFPTGGIIFAGKNLQEAYGLGKGSVVVRAKTEIVETKSGNYQIVVTEIPYQVNKSLLLEKIADLVKEKKIEEIRDIRDLSNKEGIRIIIDLKKHARPKKVLNRLFALTSLQQVLYFNLLALVSGIQVKTLSLKDILEEHLKHRQEVLKRKTQFDLMRTEERIHILKGFQICLKNIDLIIDLIKKSKDKEAAKINLEKKFSLDEKQALAILEIRLWQLAHLEREKIDQELKENEAKRKELKKILGVAGQIFELIKTELRELKEKYPQPRRTKIILTELEEFKEEDLITDEPTIVMMSRDGYIKRVSPESFRVQERGGKGIKGAGLKESDVLEHLIFTSTLANLLFFTNKGKVFQLRVYEISESERTGRGEAIVNFLNLAPGEKVSAILFLKDLKEMKYLVLATKNGLVKKMKIENLAEIRKNGLRALVLEKDDLLIRAKPSSGKDEIILFTAKGQVIRFKEEQLRILSREARGIKGIKLGRDDKIISLDIVSFKKGSEAKVFTLSENGFGKASFLSSYRLQRRAGSGIKTARVLAKTGELVMAFVVGKDEKQEKTELIIISRLGQVLKIPLRSIPTLGRVSQGVRIMRFKAKEDRVASVTLI